MVEPAHRLQLNTRTVQSESLQTRDMLCDVGRGPGGSGSAALGIEIPDTETASYVQVSVFF